MLRWQAEFAFSCQGETYMHRLSVIFQKSDTENTPLAAAPLLELAMTHIDARAACVYQTDSEGGRLVLRFAAGSATNSIGRLTVEFVGIHAQALRELRTAVDVDPVSDPLFQKFPEVLQYRFGRLFVAPLRDGERLLGIVTIGRTGAEEFTPGSAEIIGSLAGVLEESFANESLRTRLRSVSAELARTQTRELELERKIEERKLVERAKGLLQEQGLTEEAAYMQIRFHSRQRRTPMVEIAREIIAADESGADLLVRRMTA